MKLLILALSFILVLSVEYVDYLYDLKSGSYYVLLGLSAFIMFMVCFSRDDKLVHYYSYVQLVALTVYTISISTNGFYMIDDFMYGGVINYANAMMVYELLLLIVGVMDAIAWCNNDNHLSSRNYFR